MEEKYKIDRGQFHCPNCGQKGSAKLEDLKINNYMLVKEILNHKEGLTIHIFKAVLQADRFGKSFVASKMLKGTGLKSVNSDEVYEYRLANKENFDSGDPIKLLVIQGQEMRDFAKALTNSEKKFI